MSGPLVYAYGVARAARRPAAGRNWPRLPGAGPVRVLPLGSRLWLFVADVPAADFDDAALADRVKDVEWIARCGAAHHDVAVRAGRRTTFAPFRLLTLFLTDARAVASTARIRGSIERTLASIEGCREWVVRAAVDPNAARLTETRPTSGTEYLARRARDQRRGRRPPRGASKLAGELAAAVTVNARRSARRRAADPGMLLDLALLVPRTRERDVTAAVRRWSPKLASLGCRVWQTGPWPPYSFVSVGTPRRVGPA